MNKKDLPATKEGMRTGMTCTADHVVKVIEDNTERILTALGRYAHAVEDQHRAVAIHGRILTEIQLQLQDHDQRIVRLEASRGQP